MREWETKSFPEVPTKGNDKSEKSVMSEVKEVSPSFEKMSFYWLHVTPLEKILPRFLEKLYAQGVCAVIRTIHTALVEELCRLLWTYSPASFLPHGSVQDGFFTQQPFWITATNDGAHAKNVSDFHRGVYFFDAHQPEEVQKASAYGESLLKQGIPSQVLLQNPTGQWEEKGPFRMGLFV